MNKLILLFMFSIVQFSWSQEAVTTRFVDLNRYLGKWYEIASIPQSFQRKCVSDTTAEYSKDEKGEVNVYNSCLDKDGQVVGAKGHAKVVDTNSNAKLKVTFLKLGGWIFVPGGNYWVLELDSNYKWAVVGEPNQKNGWILSRTPSLPLATLKMLAEKIEAQGYDSCLFITTRQNGGFETRESLCDVIE